MYIEPKKRQQLESNPHAMGGCEDLAFVLTLMLLSYLPADPDPRDYYEILGALDVVHGEFQRMAVWPWLDAESQLNGDVGFQDLPQNKGLV